jgi:hypothetical protein
MYLAWLWVRSLALLVAPHRHPQSPIGNRQLTECRHDLLPIVAFYFQQPRSVTN